MGFGPAKYVGCRLFCARSRLRIRVILLGSCGRDGKRMTPPGVGNIEFLPSP